MVRALRLSLEKFADFRLPTGRVVSQNEAYHQLFSSRSSFVRAVELLRRLERIPTRPDGTYRIWDLYAVIREVGWFTAFDPEGEGRHGMRTNRFPDLHWLRAVEEPYWEAAERTRLIRESIWEAQYLRSIRDESTGQRRNETPVEFRRRFGRTRRDKLRQIRQLAHSLPEEREYWKKHLNIHATTVIEMRRFGFSNAARLCARQLNAAAQLGEISLGCSYRDLRELVGVSSRDFSMPALTAATFSPEHRGFDLTLDAMVETLPLYDEHVPAPLRVTATQAEALLVFLEEVGLQEWSVEYSIIAWHGEMFASSTPDRRVAVAFGRIRTLTALLEEALQSLAVRTKQPGHDQAVEAEGALLARIRTFVWGGQGQQHVLSRSQFQQVYDRHCGVRPPIDARRLAAAFDAVGVATGNPPPVATQHVPEKTLAALVLIRNIVSHRFPLSSEGERPEWFSVWGERLPAINRTILWAALLLWALSERMRSGSK